MNQARWPKYGPLCHCKYTAIKTMWMRTLTTGLEMQPALRLELLRRLGVAQLILLVVGLQQIFDDRTGLPERHTSVRVLDGGHPTCVM